MKLFIHILFIFLKACMRLLRLVEMQPTIDRKPYYIGIYFEI